MELLNTIGMLTICILTTVFVFMETGVVTLIILFCMFLQLLTLTRKIRNYNEKR